MEILNSAINQFGSCSVSEFDFILIIFLDRLVTFFKDYQTHSWLVEESALTILVLTNERDDIFEKRFYLMYWNPVFK